VKIHINGLDVGEIYMGISCSVHIPFWFISFSSR